jgi:hypothetical protein
LYVSTGTAVEWQRGDMDTRAHLLCAICFICLCAPTACIYNTDEVSMSNESGTGAASAQEHGVWTRLCSTASRGLLPRKVRLMLVCLLMLSLSPGRPPFAWTLRASSALLSSLQRSASPAPSSHCRQGSAQLRSAFEGAAAPKTFGRVYTLPHTLRQRLLRSCNRKPQQVSRFWLRDAPLLARGAGVSNGRVEGLPPVPTRPVRLLLLFLRAAARKVPRP